MSACLAEKIDNGCPKISYGVPCSRYLPGVEKAGDTRSLLPPHYPFSIYVLLHYSTWDSQEEKDVWKGGVFELRKRSGWQIVCEFVTTIMDFKTSVTQSQI